MQPGISDSPKTNRTSWKAGWFIVIVLVTTAACQLFDRDSNAGSGEIAFPNVRTIAEEVLPPRKSPVPVKTLIAQVSDAEYLASQGNRRYHPNHPVNWLFVADDPKDVELFRPLLDSDNDFLRAAACVYLGRVRDEASFDKLVERTRDDRPFVRRLAAVALGWFERVEAVPVLASLGQDYDRDVRDVLPSALARIPGAEATEALLDIYCADNERFASLCRSYALDVLIDRGDPSVVPSLIEMITPPKGRRQDSSLAYALRSLTGHFIKGDYDDPDDQVRLEREWVEWWFEHGDGVKPRPRPRAPSTTGEYSVTLISAKQTPGSATLNVYYRFVPTSDFRALVVPVADEGVHGYGRYTLYRDSQVIDSGEVERSFFNFTRYNMIPFGSITEIGAVADTCKPLVAPGDYELEIEIRFLCTELAAPDFVGNVAYQGAHRTLARTLTMKSNRIPVTIAPVVKEKVALTDKTLDRLARIMADPGATTRTVLVPIQYAVRDGIRTSQSETIRLEGAWRLPDFLAKTERDPTPFVLKHFDPEKATHMQISYLASSDSPRARAVLEREFLKGNRRVELSHIRPSGDPRVLQRIVGLATAEPGSEGWIWFDSRRALAMLDGRLGPKHKEFVRPLISELEGRLEEKRDRHILRSGESLWGAFRTCFFLGRIGDRRAVDVLLRATRAGEPDEHQESKSRMIFLCWYASAALKLVDVQNLRPPERHQAVKAWLRHCFSSPEEHFMARARLIPYLNELLPAGERRDFYTELIPSLTDSWMIFDARRYQ